MTHMKEKNFTMTKAIQKPDLPCLNNKPYPLVPQLLNTSKDGDSITSLVTPFNVWPSSS